MICWESRPLTGWAENLGHQDLGVRDGGPNPEERAALADFLGCHEEARNEVWEIWRQDLMDEGAAAYWLDVEFTQPCAEDEAP